MHPQHIDGERHGQDLDRIRDKIVSHCADLAEHLLGAPSSRNKRELRWGSHGKVVLRLSTGKWSDFSTGEWGDILDLYCRERGGGFVEALDWARTMVGIAPPVRPVRQKPVRDDEAARIVRARELYGWAAPARVYGFQYFDGRGLDYPGVVERQLRYDVGRLVFPFRDFATLEITGIHRITVERGPDGKREKKSFGRVMGSAMMLGRPADGVLAICEGLETAVAIHSHEGLPVWALSGASFMAAFGPMPGVEHLFIFADNDGNRAGQDAALACREMWREHAQVDVVTPRDAGTDFADLWRRP